MGPKFRSIQNSRGAALSEYLLLSALIIAALLPIVGELSGRAGKQLARADLAFRGGGSINTM